MTTSVVADLAKPDDKAKEVEALNEATIKAVSKVSKLKVLLSKLNEAKKATDQENASLKQRVEQLQQTTATVRTRAVAVWPGWVECCGREVVRMGECRIWRLRTQR